MFTLLIDGNYFAQRLRNSLQLTFIDNPEKDKNELFKAAATSLAYEISAYKDSLESVMIARDYSSWRKQVDQVYPIESELSQEQQTYKENRSGEKDYDVKAFYAAYDEFCSLCETKLNIPVLKTKGAEADDFVYLAAKALTSKGKQVLCWTSDGDYIHLVKANIYLVKFPKRELYTVQDKKSTATTVKTLDDIFSTKVPDRTQRLIESFDSAAVKTINPMDSLFMKVIHGDGKDNVPPIFFWKSKSGSRTYRPSANHIKKTLNALDVDSITEELMYDKDFMIKFIEQILVITKQTRDIEHTYNVYLSNLRMKHLSHKQIPRELLKDMLSVFNEKHQMKPVLSECSQYQRILDKFNVVSNDSYFAGFQLNS